MKNRRLQFGFQFQAMLGRPIQQRAVVHFGNRFSVSILTGGHSYSRSMETFEVAIIHQGELCFDTPVADDVLAYRTIEEVKSILERVRKLPLRKRTA